MRIRLFILLLFVPLLSIGQYNFFWSHTGETESYQPLIITKQITDIGSTSANLGGTIYGNDNDTILEYGVTVNETGEPDRYYDWFRPWYGEPVSFPYSFSSTISLFDRSTTYYVRAYIITSEKIIYGDEKIFTTDD